MKYIIIILLLPIYANSQNIDSAGTCLKKSANYKIASHLSAGISAVCYVKAAQQAFVMKDNTSTRTAGLVFALIGSITESLSIWNIWQAGKQLRK